MLQDLEPSGRPTEIPLKPDFDSSPLLVFYEVTQACDLVCRHCRACAQPNPLPSELSTESSLRLIEQLTTFPDPPHLVLTGGDPLKRADIFQLIEHAVAVGLDVSITPSATPLMTPEAIRRLGQSGISRMAVSIDGADAVTHDTTRGVEGSFARSLEILNQARQEGIPTQINTTLTPGNVDQIDRMAELFAGLGITMWSVFFLVPVGRADDMPQLSASEYETAFERLFYQSQRRPYAIKTTEAPHYRRYLLQHRNEQQSGSPFAKAGRFSSLGVNDGKGIMFISHAGLIFPSGFLPIVCGAYPFDSVVDVYQKSNVFVRLRDPDSLEGKCGACNFRHLCGGSRARALAVSGDLFAEEPCCEYQPKGTGLDPSDSRSLE